MINRDELLKDLGEGLSNEEELTEKIAVFYQALGWKSVMKEEYHDSVIKGLTTIEEDSRRHAVLMGEMIGYIERSDKNEF